MSKVAGNQNRISNDIQYEKLDGELGQRKRVFEISRHNGVCHLPQKTRSAQKKKKRIYKFSHLIFLF